MKARTQPFGDRLAEHVAKRESQVVLGLDPDPAALWPQAHATASDASRPTAQRAAAAVLAHCIALIDAAGPACVAVKPQLACFERLGAPGREVLAHAVEHAAENGLLVVADGKRGDIDVSARAYAQSLFGGLQTPFGHVAGLGVDAATVNPLMGRDAIAPFIEAARPRGAGVLVLVRTSNRGAAELQDARIAADRAADPESGGEVALWERIAAVVGELGREGVSSSGLSDVGAVVGATVPGHLRRARELMPSAVLLLPGIGAQGGRVEDLAPAFKLGRAGGLVSASRSIAGAHLQAGGSPADAAREEAERLREAAWAISG